LTGPLIVVPLDDPDRPGEDLAERRQQVFLSHLGVLEDSALELGPSALRPPGRLRVIQEVPDVDDLVRLVLADELDDPLQRLPVMQRDLRIRKDHDSLAHTNLSSRVIRNSPTTAILTVKVIAVVLSDRTNRAHPVVADEYSSSSGCTGAVPGPGVPFGRKRQADVRALVHHLLVPDEGCLAAPPV